MKLVDDVGLPEQIMRALERDPYNKGASDISVTGLLKPPIMRALESQYDSVITESASGRIYALLGKAVHAILEMADLGDTEKYLTEKRFFVERDDMTVSGQVDLIEYETRTLHDFKVCSRWVGVFGAKEEWEQQLNLYRLLAYENGVEVDTLKIHAIYRDWSKREAKQKSDYPKKQIETFIVPTWSISKAETFLQHRIRLHKEMDEKLYSMLSMDDLRGHVCTPEERWERDRGFAVVKGTNTKAIRVLDTRVEAEDWIRRNKRAGEELRINERIGSPVRCLDYCNVKQWCPFGARLKDG